MIVSQETKLSGSNLVLAKVASGAETAGLRTRLLNGTRELAQQ